MFTANGAQQMGSTAAREAQPYALSCSGHHRAQDVVDAGGIASSIPPEPVVNVAVQAGGDQHLGRTAELCQLFIGQRSAAEPQPKRAAAETPSVDYLWVESQCSCGVYVLVRKKLAKKTRIHELAMRR